MLIIIWSFLLEEFFRIFLKNDICTICTNTCFFVEKREKGKYHFSTFKNKKNSIKWSFAQSYPHYPQKKQQKLWNTFAEKRTNVL